MPGGTWGKSHFPTDPIHWCHHTFNNWPWHVIRGQKIQVNVMYYTTCSCKQTSAMGEFQLLWSYEIICTWSTSCKGTLRAHICTMMDIKAKQTILCNIQYCMCLVLFSCEGLSGWQDTIKGHCQKKGLIPVLNMYTRNVSNWEWQMQSTQVCLNVTLKDRYSAPQSILWCRDTKIFSW